MTARDHPAGPRRTGPRSLEAASAPTRRTFTAVFPPPEVLEALAAIRSALEPELPGLRWTAAGNLHFTLRFFGELIEEEIVRAGEVLAVTASETRPFRLELAGLGVFPGWKRPRVLWVGCREGSEVLEALARTLERGFREARLGRADKPFRAHLTLGRWRDGGGLDPETLRRRCEAVGEVASFTVSQASVVESTLAPGGSIYRPLHTAAFSGPDGAR